MEKRSSITVEITMGDGEAKKATKFSMNEVTDMERLVILQGVFKALNVDLDLEPKNNVDVKIANAYESFFNPEKKNEQNTLTEITSSNENTKTQSQVRILAVEKAKSSIIENSINNEMPEHFKTGIKVTPSGNLYQCRLHCERCSGKKTHYIKLTDITVNCRYCQKIHAVRQAKKDKLKQDSMKNFFIAGTFIGEDEAINANL